MTIASKVKNDFINSYVEALLWIAPEDDEGNNLDEFSFSDIDSEAMEEIKTDCDKFLKESFDLILETPDWYSFGQAGHDFALTRNGHGVGFWDRGLKDIGEKLTAIAETYGEQDLYLGDDGTVYVM